MKKHLLLYLKKIRSAPCWVAIFLSCGKDIKTTDEDKSMPSVTRAPADASIITLRISTDNENKGIILYKSPTSGWAKVPAKPFIQKSIAQIVYSKLSFEMPGQGNFSPATKLICDYISFQKKQPHHENKTDGYKHQFVGCKEDIDLDGVDEELNYIPGDEIPLDENEIIKFEVHSSDSDDQIEIESDIEVKWR